MRLTRTIISAFVMSALLGAAPIVAQEDTSAVVDPHAAVFSEDDFPSASTCAGCHQQIYDEWSSSSHAYSAISPMFHRFEQTITDLAPTIGTFCVRCHMSVGTMLGEDRAAPLWERSRVSLEGVTCVSCHRVAERHVRANGERHIEPGPIFAPVYGSSDGSGVQQAIADRGRHRLATAPGERGSQIHTEAIQFEQISQSEFCVSCHQVTVNLGIKLEVVWDQYRASPAAAQGITCQDCHMGTVPGRAEGYAQGPAAILAGGVVNAERRHSNHAFYGPGYPIAHPGIFPHNPEGERWSISDWLQFDYRAGWGSPDFEAQVLDGEVDESIFPEIWADSFDREEAWAVIETNLARLERKRDLRRAVMENGSRIDGPFFRSEPAVGRALRFHYTVTNTNIGHNLPSGSLGAQPELWLNVALIDPDGNTVWESGHVDSNGDMLDLHSLDVRAGRMPRDRQLFNLQTKFLTTNVKGTDREAYLPVNFDFDQLPFLRPPAQPVSVLNHPPFVRMEGRSLPPGGSRDASYTVPASALTKPGTYRLAVRMRSRAEPIYFMRFVGATAEMEQAMNEWMLDVHPYTVEFELR